MEGVGVMNIFEEVQRLNLPLGEYAVVSSGTMMAHGIREARDIDLLVTPRLYTELKTRGWEAKQLKPTFTVVKNGIAEASPEMIFTGSYRPDIFAIIARAEIINGVVFQTLTDVLDFKRALNRAKDITDIALIAKYLKNEHS